MLTQERLKELLHYDPETGVFTWKVSKSSRAPLGSSAGTITKRGYIQICVDHTSQLAHRLAWLYTYGEFPDGMLDHENRSKGDNRISNLRPATNKQNQENTGVWSTNTSGVKGVIWRKERCKWTSRIYHHNKLIHIGDFDTPEEASAAYEAMRDKLFTHHKKAA